MSDASTATLVPAARGRRPSTTTAGTSTCPCHGSQYNGNGDVTHGPAPASLNHFAISFTGTGADALVVVDVNTIETDRSRRFPPPA